MRSTESGATPRRETSAPASRARAARDRLFVSTIFPGPGSSPTGTSSLPVQSSATRGRRCARTEPTPQAAASARSAASSTRPGGSASAPAVSSSPRRRMCCPDFADCCTRTVAPSRTACSCMTTQSAPGGNGAPVKMRAASPLESDRDQGGSPAAISPATRRGPPASLARSA